MAFTYLILKFLFSFLLFWGRLFAFSFDCIFLFSADFSSSSSQVVLMVFFLLLLRVLVSYLSRNFIRQKSHFRSINSSFILESLSLMTVRFLNKINSYDFILSHFILVFLEICNYWLALCYPHKNVICFRFTFSIEHVQILLGILFEAE